jgi:rhodanese-related sulfurtransferase
VNFFVDNWILILVAFVSGGMLVWPMVRRGGGGAAAVPTGEAVRLINREKAVLVDVSEADEYAAGHAGGARHIPLGQLEGSRDLPTNKALPVLLMCPTGARSARAAAMLRKAGYTRAVAVTGGTRAWREAQLPVERGEPARPAAKAARPERGAEKGAEKGAAKAAPEKPPGSGNGEGDGQAPGEGATTTAAEKSS